MQSVEDNERIVWRLPARVSTAGGSLAHSIHVLNGLFDRHAPMTFKIGFTHDPCWRWENTLYGYRWSKADKWEQMCVMYLSEEPYSAAMLEAALIEKFKSYLATPL